MFTQTCNAIDAEAAPNLLPIAGWFSSGAREQRFQNAEDQDSQPRARNNKS
jgi:hypothetical protein